MKCEKCIHSDICKLFDVQGVSEESPCSFFKCKDKFIELPCHVGSEVYVTVNGKRFMQAKLYGKNETGAYLVFVEISEHKHIYDWFRKIYTKEEVEQALKGSAKLAESEEL